MNLRVATVCALCLQTLTLTRLAAEGPGSAVTPRWSTAGNALIASDEGNLRRPALANPPATETPLRSIASKNLTGNFSQHLWLHQEGSVTTRIIPGSNLAIGLNRYAATDSVADLDFAFVITSTGVNSTKAQAMRGTTKLGNPFKITIESLLTIKRDHDCICFLHETDGGPSTEIARSPLTALGPLRVEAILGTAHSGMMQTRIVHDDSDFDTLPDGWEQTHFANLSQEPNQDPDNDDRTNRDEFKDQTNPRDPRDRAAPIQWLRGINAVANAQLGTLGKSPDATAGYNSSAAAYYFTTNGTLRPCLLQAEGSVTFEPEIAPSPSQAAAFIGPIMALGLAVPNDSEDLDGLLWRFVIESSGRITLRVPESSQAITIQGLQGTCYSGSQLRLTRRGNRISFYHDGNLLYESTTTYTGLLQVDCSLSSQQTPTTALATISRASYDDGDKDQDGLPDTWETGFLPPDSGWADLSLFSQQGDADNDGVTDGEEYIDGTNPNNALSHASAITWGQLNNTTTQNANKLPQGNGYLRKVASGKKEAFDADAIAVTPNNPNLELSIEEDGLLSIQAQQGSTLVIGLTGQNNDPGDSDCEWAFSLNANNSFTLITTPERNDAQTPRGLTGTYDSTTRFSIQRSASVITFLKDQEPIYTATSSSSGPLIVECCIKTTVSLITRARLYNGDTDHDNLPDAWELQHFNQITDQHSNQDPDNDNSSNLEEYLDGTDPNIALINPNPLLWNPNPAANASVSAQGNCVTKNHLATSAWNTDASAVLLQTPNRPQPLRLGRYGILRFTASDLGQLAMGLSSTDSVRDFSKHEFGMLLSPATDQDPGRAQIIENNRKISGITETFYPDTRFAIRRVGRRIEYLKDRRVIYRSTNDAKLANYGIKTSLFTSDNAQTPSVNEGASLTSARLNNGDSDNDGLPDEWEITQILRSNPQSPINYNSIAAYLGSSDSDNDGFNNRWEYQHGTDPLLNLDHPQAIVWNAELLRNTSTTNANNQTPDPQRGFLRKISPSNSYNADAVSKRSSSGDLNLSFSLPCGDASVGLNRKNTNAQGSDIDYGFTLTASGGIALRYPGGGETLSEITYNADSVFTLQRIGSTIEFFLDGCSLELCPCPAEDTLLVDCAFKTPNLSLTCCYLNFEDQDEDSLPDRWEWDCLLGLHQTPTLDQWATLGRLPNSDFDGDSICDREEYQLRSNANSDDSDGDGMTDGWEQAHQLALTDSDNANSDLDSDGLSNLLEFRHQCDPRNPDTDGDSLIDGIELHNRSNPTLADSDLDLINDPTELSLNFDPSDPLDAAADHDQDLIPSGIEIQRGTDPFSAAHSPPPDAIVNSSITREDTNSIPSQHRTLSSAINHLNRTNSQTCHLIAIQAGTQNGSLDRSAIALPTPNKPLILLAARPDPQTQCSPVILSNHSINLSHSSQFNQIQLEGCTLQIRIEGTANPRVTLSNCLLINTRTEISPTQPAPITLHSGTLHLAYCTLYNFNSCNSIAATDGAGHFIANLNPATNKTPGPSIQLHRSVLWSDQSPTPLGIAGSYALEDSILQGHPQASNPNLTQRAQPGPQSHCLHPQNLTPHEALDILGRRDLSGTQRDNHQPTLGAIEQSDRDGDGVNDALDSHPDYAELWNDRNGDGINDSINEEPQSPSEPSTLALIINDYPDANPFEPYQTNLEAEGGTAPYQFSSLPLTADQLPLPEANLDGTSFFALNPDGGLSANFSTLDLQDLRARAGSGNQLDFQLRVQVQDQNGQITQANITIRLVLTSQPPRNPAGRITQNRNGDDSLNRQASLQRNAINPTTRAGLLKRYRARIFSNLQQREIRNFNLESTTVEADEPPSGGGSQDPKTEECSVCNGTGGTETVCKKCMGTGEREEDCNNHPGPCLKCGGSGRMRGPKTKVACDQCPEPQWILRSGNCPNCMPGSLREGETCMDHRPISEWVWETPTCGACGGTGSIALDGEFVACNACNGDPTPYHCDVCNNSGKIKVVCPTTQKLACTNCNGSGRTIKRNNNNNDDDGGGGGGDGQNVNLFSASITASSGNQGRRVSLSGHPLPDHAPAQQNESGEAPEQTHLDSFSLDLRHSTTDLYIPLPHSLLSLSLRRDLTQEGWNNQHGLNPGEQPNLPFGPCWRSNACSSIIVDDTSGPGSLAAAQATVTDEQGQTHIFHLAGTTWSRGLDTDTDAQNITDKLEYDLTKAAPLTQLILRKKFGITCTFELTTLQTIINQNRALGGASSSPLYYRLTKVRDRWGNSILYKYATPTTLIPSHIYDPKRPGAYISIEQNAEGVITKARTGAGTTVTYSYKATTLNPDCFINRGSGLIQYTNPAQLQLLSSVTKGNPRNPGTRYTYHEDQQAPETEDPEPASEEKPQVIAAQMHLALGSITNELNQTHQFTWACDNSFLNQRSGDTQPIGSLDISRPLRLQCITRSDLGSTISIHDPLQNKAPDRPRFIANGTFSGIYPATLTTRITGPGGTYEWTFSNPCTFVRTNHTNIAHQTSLTAYTTTDIQAANLHETLHFLKEPGLHLASRTDLSGNSTTYTYTDEATSDLGLLASLRISNHKTRPPLHYNEPNTITDANGNTQRFTYHPLFRILQTQTDANGNLTTYEIDSRGRRTSQTLTPAGSNQPQQLKTWLYQDAQFPGRCTAEITHPASGEPHNYFRVTRHSLATRTRQDPTFWCEQTVTSGIGSNKGIINTLQHRSTTIQDSDGRKLWEIDGNQNLTAHQYDDQGRLTKTTHPDGTTTTHTYDAHGNLTQTLDPEGILSFKTYDAHNRLISATLDLNGNQKPDPLPKGNAQDNDGDLITTYTYNDRGQVVEHTNPGQAPIVHNYDAIGRLIAISQAQRITSHSYGPNSGGSLANPGSAKPTQTTAPNGLISTHSYDPAGRLTSTTTAPDGGTTTFDYDPNGNLTTTTDPLLKRTQHQYDSFNRCISTTTHDGSTTTQTHNFDGNLITLTDPLGNRTQRQYDALGRCISTTAPDGGTTTQNYDLAGNLIITTDPLGRQHLKIYDALNRLTQSIAPPIWDGLSGQYACPITRHYYNRAGRIIATLSPDGQLTRQIWDRAGRLHTTITPDGATTTYTHAPSGHILTVTNPRGHITRNRYDSWGNLIETTDQSGIAQRFEYDPANNRTLVTDGLGNSTRLTYDSLSRLTSTTYPNGDRSTRTYNAVQLIREDNGTQSTHHSYDNCGRLIRTTTDNLTRHFTYDRAGRLTATRQDNQPAATTNQTYDPCGRLLTESSQGLTHTHRYDLCGNRIQTTYADGRTITTTYNSLNLPELIAQAASPRTHQTRIVYDLCARPVMQIAANGTLHTDTHDACGRLINRATFANLNAYNSNAAPIHEQGYQHDLNGNLIQLAESWPTPIANNGNNGTRPSGTRQTLLTYDASNRLIRESITNPGQPTQITTFTWDAASNRTSKVITLGNFTTTHTSTYNNSNQLLRTDLTSNNPAVANTTTTHTYDARGNRIQTTKTSTGSTPQTTSLAWDDEGHLESVTLPNRDRHSYRYDHRIRRIQSSQTGTLNKTTDYSYCGGLVTSQYESLGLANRPTLPTVTYTRGPDLGGGVGGLLYSQRPAGSSSNALLINHANARGDIIAQSNLAQSLTWTASYEAFGSHRFEFGSNPDSQRANSKEEDPTGYLHEHHRYRDIENETWLSRDPAGFVDGPNVYAYCKQNPWSSFDPDGLATNKPRAMDPEAMGGHGSFISAAPVNRSLEFRYLFRPARPQSPNPIQTQHQKTPTPSTPKPTQVSAATQRKPNPAAPEPGENANTPTTPPSPAGSARTIQENAKKLADAAGAGQGGARREGIYEFPDQKAGGTPYVGQSGDLASRLSKHVSSGRLKPGTEATTEVAGGKTMREIAEHKRIQEMTGGIPASKSDAVSNKVDPIGPKRQHLLLEE